MQLGVEIWLLFLTHKRVYVLLQSVQQKYERWMRTMEIIKDIKADVWGTLGCVNHDGGDDQYNEDDGSGINCGGSVTN